VSTRLTIGVLKNALVVPETAVQRSANGLFVFVVDDQNRAAMRPIVVSHEDEDQAVIDKGVNEGDRVVTVGQYVLQPGSPVAIDTAANTGS
jgi:multidrug efflux system membrane fusion protein